MRQGQALCTRDVSGFHFCKRLSAFCFLFYLQKIIYPQQLKGTASEMQKKFQTFVALSYCLC